MRHSWAPLERITSIEGSIVERNARKFSKDLLPLLIYRGRHWRRLKVRGKCEGGRGRGGEGVQEGRNRIFKIIYLLPQPWNLTLSTIISVVNWKLDISKRDFRFAHARDTFKCLITGAFQRSCTARRPWVFKLQLEKNWRNEKSWRCIAGNWNAISI